MPILCIVGALVAEVLWQRVTAKKQRVFSSRD